MRRHDPQAKTVYLWELCCLEGDKIPEGFKLKKPVDVKSLPLQLPYLDPLTEDEAQALVDHIWDLYDQDSDACPWVEIRKRRRFSACYQPTDNLIILPGGKEWPAGRGTTVVCHETAHAVLHWQLDGMLTEPHGPLFCHTYALMLSACTNLTAYDILESMEAFGIRTR